MTDFMTPKQRSQTMSKVRGKNIKPEKLIRTYLHRQGFRFRINNPKLPGKPDIVLKKYNAAIFVLGCFWHHLKEISEIFRNSKNWTGELQLSGNVQPKTKRIYQNLAQSLNPG
jgi:DNA mismatch endonuclease (patch repair protein)